MGGSAANRGAVVRVSIGVALATLLVGGVHWALQAVRQAEPAAGVVLVAPVAPAASPEAIRGPDTAEPAEATVPAAAHETPEPVPRAPFGPQDSRRGPAPTNGDDSTAADAASAETGLAGSNLNPSGPDAAPPQSGSGTGGTVDGAEATMTAARLQPTRPFVWHDGDRTLTVWLQPDLAMRPEGDTITRDDIVSTAGEAAAQSYATVEGRSRDLPVFRSDAGRLMSLPGGVALVLDPSLDASAVAAFLERNGIRASRATALDYVANGYLIETEPGLESLLLANDLAAQDNVVLSSPNWWVEATLE